MVTLEEVIVVIFGLMIGSFLNVCIYRIPLDLSIILPCSFCPHCKTIIKPWENIPVLSYIFLKGKCRHCQKKISLRYPLVETLTAAMFLLVWFNFWTTLNSGLNFDLNLDKIILNLIFVSVLIVITFIDIDHLLIHDKIIYPAMAIGVICQLIFNQPSLLNNFIQVVLGILVGGGIIYLFALLGRLVFRREAMGGGDIKLGTLIGIYLDWKMSLLSVFLACIVGSGISLALMGLKKKKKTDYIAFGPFLALGAVISLFWGKRILSWYLGRW
ncbi:prepilin peptidase [bacterium]|nr:prepilin peptidase [bacterium]